MYYIKKKLASGSELSILFKTLFAMYKNKVN